MPAENLPLVELAALLTSATAFVGHDSGITHLAAALDLPVIALWGETSEAVWRPKGNVKVLKGARGIASLEPRRVIDTVVNVLNQRIKIS